VTASKVLLSWNSSTDDFGPISYEVLVNGVPTLNAWSSRLAGAPTAPSTGAWVRQLEPATTYQFSVRSRDGSGNVSAPSNTVTVTTDPVSTPDTTPPTSPDLISAGSAGTSYCPEEQNHHREHSVWYRLPGVVRNQISGGRVQSRRSASRPAPFCCRWSGSSIVDGRRSAMAGATVDRTGQKNEARAGLSVRMVALCG
jgi:Fibronectin type III domain